MRITDPKQLEQFSGRHRERLEAELKESARQGAELVERGLARAPRRGYQEEQVGRRLTAWVDQLQYVHPDLGELIVGDYWYHVPNGGGRTRAEGGALKAQGVRAGWPDYGLDLPVGRWHGFRIEIKRDDGSKPTPDQLTYLARLERAGYAVAVAWGAEESAARVLDYLWPHGLTGLAKTARLATL